MSELKMKVLRNVFTENTSIGDLSIEGQNYCYTLEDKDRGLLKSMTLAETEKIKVYGDTAIGYGTHEVDITFSNKFQIHYPIVIGVVGYSGIRWHCGVNKTHTLGCLLLGMVKTVDGLVNSEIAFYKVFERMLIFKTNTETASQLIAIHRAARSAKKSKNEVLFRVKSAEFKEIYEKSKNKNKMFVEYTK